MVAVAQLVESRIVIPVVVGSNPIGHPIKIKHLARLLRVFCCPHLSEKENGALAAFQQCVFACRIVGWRCGIDGNMRCQYSRSLQLTQVGI
jgi:hypothetical protein